MKKKLLTVGCLLAALSVGAGSSVLTYAKEKNASDGYKNILLLGIDARNEEFFSGTQTDVMMILSVNESTKESKIVSVYRDTYLKIADENGGGFYSKVNAAYNMGGIDLALSTLNTNLDLNLSDYVVVNFQGMSNLVDRLGGIDLTITEEERKLINQYSQEMTAGTEAEQDALDSALEEAGEVHLNGLQTTAYCRIRYASYYDAEGNEYRDDFGRTKRQREVMKRLIGNLKITDIGQILAISTEVLGDDGTAKGGIGTNLSVLEIADLAPSIMSVDLTENVGFPFEYETPVFAGTDPVVPADLNWNVEELHQFLYDDGEYQVTDQINEISQHIQEVSGVYSHN